MRISSFNNDQNELGFSSSRVKRSRHWTAIVALNQWLRETPWLAEVLFNGLLTWVFAGSSLWPVHRLFVFLDEYMGK